MQNQQFKQSLQNTSQNNQIPNKESQLQNLIPEYQDETNVFSYYDINNHRSHSSEDEDEQIRKLDNINNHFTTDQTIEDINITKNVQANSNHKQKSQIIIKQKNSQLQNKIKLNQNQILVQKQQKNQIAQKVKQTKNIQKKHVDSKQVKINKDKYAEDLAAQMQQMKKKFQGKGKQKSKIQQLVNKTMGKAFVKQISNDQQQLKMLNKMAIQKKKANYQMLRQWDKKRAQSMGLHGKMIEMLQNQVDIRIKSSLQNFQLYQGFFRQKAKQQQKYVGSPVINTRYALQNNSLSKNVYINCSVILNSLCDQNTRRCQKINDFVELIRGSILRQLTQTHLQASQKQLLKIRQKISTLRNTLNKQNSTTQQKSTELALLFNQQTSAPLATKEDFYRTQLSFLRGAQQQMHLQKTLGEYCLQYYRTAIKEEMKRSQVVRQAMVTYSRGLAETYGLQLQQAEMQQMSKHEQINLIYQFFALQEMFDSRTLQLFKSRLHLTNSESFSQKIFQNYIQNFSYPVFDSRLLLLKEFQVKYLQTNKSSQIHGGICTISITVDNFLHIFINKQNQVYQRPDLTLKIGSKNLQVRSSKDDIVEIIQKQQKRHSMMSLFWQSKPDRIYRVKFAKKDNKQEFMDYLTRLTPLS